ncbi:unnamed protein product, partial [Mesorhabditis belari]|uniref:Uncharacterized protein n=1 Tax=Mesorhabditis belari TaxID=2138241 RepID=A0AAF3F2S6_9BILA
MPTPSRPHDSTAGPVPGDGHGSNKWVEAFLDDCRKMGTNGMLKQYRKNRSYIAPNYSFEAFTENPQCNRYSDVVCLDESRVMLKIEKPGEGDYIHANWVRLANHDRVYIATQAPIDHTIHDFWRMCFQNDVFCIVNLARQTENGRASCAQYWPEKVGHFYTLPQNGGYLVNNKKVEHEDKFTLSTIEVVPNECSEGKVVKMIQFLEWPDKGIPLGSRVILRLLRLITRQDKLAARQGNVVVHCSAGIGRTGTIILIDWMLQAILHRHEHVDATALFMELRRQRAHSIQTEGQWLFIYQSVLEYMRLKYPKYAHSIEKMVAEIRALNLN